MKKMTMMVKGLGINACLRAWLFICSYLFPRAFVVYHYTGSHDCMPLNYLFRLSGFQGRLPATNQGAVMGPAVSGG